jgi:uncharacterized cupredoxin-like copper-binding protein
MHRSPLAPLAAVVLLAAACTPSPASTPVASGTPAPAPTVSAPSAAPVSVAPSAAAPSPAAPSVSAATRIEVRLTDSMTIEPGAMTVPAGVPVTFVVTNEGFLDHEFYLGDEAAQAAHEAEMLEMGGMTHDDPEGIAVAPGETKELTYTFASPGESLAGCHVAGHYLANMKATIVIEG